MFWVYILQSLRTNHYYIGQTNNLERRLKDHERGKDFSSRLGMPWQLVFSKECQTRKEAMALEKYLKSLKSRVRLEKFYRGVEQSGSSSGS